LRSSAGLVDVAIEVEIRTAVTGDQTQ